MFVYRNSDKCFSFFFYELNLFWGILLWYSSQTADFCDYKFVSAEKT